MALIGTLNSSVSAMASYMQGLNVIGNNIANVNTTGFKSGNAQYSDSFSNILQSSTPSTAATNGTPAIAVGAGVQLSGVSTDFSQGALQTTGTVTNLAISGQGYFQVKDPLSGNVYATRDGSFNLNSQGYLVNSQGYRLQGLTGAGLGTVGDIQLGTPPTGTQLQSIAIDNGGNMVETYSDGSTATTNQVEVQQFTDQSALLNVGHNLYTNLLAAGPVGAPAGSVALQAGGTNAPGTNGLGAIESGALEGSNVDLTAQFANLITTQRSFEASSRLLTISDSILEDVVNMKSH
jgi:flagellar hook protein FlgE